VIPEEPQVQKEGISRRRMLKRVGVGAAIAWTAPVVTSMLPSAFATGPPPGCPGGVSCNGCGPILNSDKGCSQGACTGGLGCFNSLDTSGACQNFQNIFCSCLTACTDNSQCGASSACLCSNNGCGGSFCVPCCGTNCHRPAKRGRSGKTAAPR
jgi:hypothetical protein